MSESETALRSAIEAGVKSAYEEYDLVEVLAIVQELARPGANVDRLQKQAADWVAKHVQPAARAEYEWGRQCGWGDGTHPSGVVTHVSHRDPEAWAAATTEFRQGYEAGWAEARWQG